MSGISGAIDSMLFAVESYVLTDAEVIFDCLEKTLEPIVCRNIQSPCPSH